jgi:hypothetical protein
MIRVTPDGSGSPDLALPRRRSCRLSQGPPRLMNENFITLSSRILRDLDQGEDVVGIQHEQQRWRRLAFERYSYIRKYTLWYYRCDMNNVHLVVSTYYLISLLTRLPALLFIEPVELSHRSRNLLLPRCPTVVYRTICRSTNNILM